MALGNNRFVVVNTYDGKTYVHIRKYEESQSRTFPTSSGVAMTVPVFAALMANLAEIDDAVKSLKDKEPNFSSFKVHLGNGVFCKIEKDYQCIDFRRYFVPEGEKAYIPTKKGLALTLKQWEIARERMEEIKNYIPPMEYEFFARVFNIY